MSDRLLSCEHCRFWHTSRDGRDGTCQRHAPVALPPGRMDWRATGVWPSTRPTDTCGDFSWREAAPVPLRG